MIGCGIYTDNIECIQYINDVAQMKILYLFILIILAVLAISFVKSNKYKSLVKKYETIHLMFLLPKYSSYLFFATLILIPYFLSINTELETFLSYINVFLWINIVWMLLFVLALLADWISNRLGFKSTSHFIKSTITKR